MKKIVLLICFLLLSGCTVNYNITIKNDGTVIEKSTMGNQTIKNNKEFEKVKESILSQYDITLKKYGYKYDISNDNNKIKVNINRNSKINNYFDYSIYKKYFEDYELYTNNNIVHFKTVGENYLKELFIVKNYEQDLEFKKAIDKLKINITFEGEVIDSNADEINEKTNTYTWIYDKNNTNKGIQFSYKIITNEKTEEKNLDKEKKRIFSTKFIITIGVLVILFFLIFLMKRSIDVNKL